jgi:hypothetical protein
MLVERQQLTPVRLEIHPLIMLYAGLDLPKGRLRRNAAERGGTRRDGEATVCLRLPLTSTSSRAYPAVPHPDVVNPQVASHRGRGGVTGASA